MPGLPGRPTILTEGRVDQVYQATCPSSNWLMVSATAPSKKSKCRVDSHARFTRQLDFPT